MRRAVGLRNPSPRRHRLTAQPNHADTLPDQRLSGQAPIPELAG